MGNAWAQPKQSSPPPPLQILGGAEVVEFLWSGENSVVKRLLKSLEEVYNPAKLVGVSTRTETGTRATEGEGEGLDAFRHSKPGAVMEEEEGEDGDKEENEESIKREKEGRVREVGQINGKAHPVHEENDCRERKGPVAGVGILPATGRPMSVPPKVEAGARARAWEGAGAVAVAVAEGDDSVFLTRSKGKTKERRLQSSKGRVKGEEDSCSSGGGQAKRPGIHAKKDRSGGGRACH
ncbi:unnamed protein product, partial [Discosporangium mesarthrocarpum]